ncbi:hypothetical protein M758_10G107200 [Ceratodon purpureus]|nr:hypothetical protein M758_10G107200 [Ceratodon purpureus]
MLIVPSMDQSSSSILAFLLLLGMCGMFRIAGDVREEMQCDSGCGVMWDRRSGTLIGVWCCEP